MVKYYCDRCGKEVYQLYKISYPLKHCVIQYEDKKEVCRECYNEIVDFIKKKK